MVLNGEKKESNDALSELKSSLEKLMECEKSIDSRVQKINDLVNKIEDEHTSSSKDLREEIDESMSEISRMSDKNMDHIKNHILNMC